MTQRPARSVLRSAAAASVVALTLGVAGCASGDPAVVGRPAVASSAPTTVDPTTVDPTTAAPTDGAAPPAAVGTVAASNRVTFVPNLVVLPGGAAAPVQPAATRDGELQVPENVQHVGWWDGSAEVGDPFGNTVVAGHVDSATDGLGF
ncbi:MAG: hypothetical protein ACRYG2_13645, partial [Janthinobacterium lividum]